MKNHIVKIKVVAILCVISTVLAGCGMLKRQMTGGKEGEGKDLDGKDRDGNDMTASYYQITQEEAGKMMERNDGHVIIDVRRQEEYDEGHISGAICIPNESIADTQPEELPDFEQCILVYCRSGRRSKEAAKKLADIGYTNIYEFGGIIDWMGEIVTGEIMTETEPVSEPEVTTLSFESFDGGGPAFDVYIDDNEIVSYERKVRYRNADHAKMTGSGYTVTFSFTGIKPGETKMLIEERSPIADNLDRKYNVVVDEELHVSIEELSVVDIYDQPEELQE